MKRLITFVLALMLALSIFIFTSFATDTQTNSVEEVLMEENEQDASKISEYITEKIVPIVVGTLTSISALLATLGGIKRSISSIKEAKETFENEAVKRDKGFAESREYLEGQVREIKEIISIVPLLQVQLEEIKESLLEGEDEMYLLAEMLDLGLSEDKEAVRRGDGKKIRKIYELIKEIRSTRKNSKGMLTLDTDTGISIATGTNTSVTAQGRVAKGEIV